MEVKHQLYQGNVQLVFDEDRHVYTVAGEKVEGVTSVLGVINKPQLIPWAVKETANYIKTNLLPGIMLDEVQIETLCEQAKGAHRRKKEEAGNIGKLVHAFVENCIKDPTNLPDMPVNEQARHGCEAFLTWREQHKVEFLSCEKVVYSKKYKYAGTYDFLAIIDGKKMLGDIKTSSGIYDEYFFQTAAYELALREEFGKEGATKGHIILNCKKEPDRNGQIFETRETTEIKENAKTFLAALTLHRRIQELKSRKV